MVMKHLKYIALILFVWLGAACEQLPLPNTELTIKSEIVTEVTANSAVIEVEFNPTAATIQNVYACYTSTEKTVMEKVADLKYRVNLLALDNNTEYHVHYMVTNSFSSVTLQNNLSFTTQTQIEKPTSPYFSVSQTKYITFSPGNLQYTQSTNTWSFAENQWDMIGTDNVTGGSVSSNSTFGDTKSGTGLADKVDLFGWSTSANNFGVSTSEDDKDYSGSFVDWGTNQIGADAPNTWRTLTYDEWKYLLNTRPNASSLKGVAQVNGVNGLILLPDNWTCSVGVTFKSGFHSNYGVEYYAAYQTFTAEQWSKLESAGAVFLPAAGYRHGSTVSLVQDNGDYWSATENTSDSAYYLSFASGGAGKYSYYRRRGHSVRLVKDL